jgi:hypothetical protein
MTQQAAEHQATEPILEVTPLVLSLANKKQPSDTLAYIYIASDKARSAEWGHLQLSIANSGDTAIEITAASLLELNFPTVLLSTADIEAIQLAPESMQLWDLTLVKSRIVQLKLKPGKTLSLSKGPAQTIGLDGVLCASGQPGDLQGTFAWKNLGAVADNTRQFRCTLEFAPQSKETDAGIRCEFSTRPEYGSAINTVYVTPYTITTEKAGIANRLVLRIENRMILALKKVKTEIVVLFPTDSFGDSRTALCTNEQLNRVTCTQNEIHDDIWTIEAPTDGKTRYWILKPPAAGTDVFGKENFVSFEFSNLVTQMLQTPSPVVVHWRGIKDYSAGYTLATVSKTEPVPFVTAFRAQAGARALSEGDAVDFKSSVHLDWNLFAADSCMVTGVDAPMKPNDSLDVFPARASNGYTVTPQILIGGTLKNGFGRTINLRLNPPTASLRADPPQLTVPLPLTPLATNTNLIWDCKSGDCVLSGPGLQPEKVNLSGAREVSAGLTPYTIECKATLSATAEVLVRLPSSVAVIKVEDVPGQFMKLTWNSYYADACEVNKGIRLDTGDLSGTAVVSRELNGTANIDFPVATVILTGNGTYTATIGIFKKGPEPFPYACVTEEKTATGIRITWKFENATSAIITGPQISSDVPGSGRTEISNPEPNRKYFMKAENARGQFVVTLVPKP